MYVNGVLFVSCFLGKLRFSHSLGDFFFDGNNIGADGAKAIAQALQTNRTLSLL